MCEYTFLYNSKLKNDNEENKMFRAINIKDKIREDLSIWESLSADGIGIANIMSQCEQNAHYLAQVLDVLSMALLEQKEPIYTRAKTVCSKFESYLKANWMTNSMTEALKIWTNDEKDSSLMLSQLKKPDATLADVLYTRAMIDNLNLHKDDFRKGL